MSISPRDWTALAAVVPALFLASCTVPQEAAAPAPPAPEAAPVASKLSPANATFDLETEGLKLLWQQQLGQLSANGRLRDIYCAGGTVVVEAAQGEVHCLDSSTGIWRATAVLKDQLRRAPVAMDAKIYFVVKNLIYTFDLATGELSENGHEPGFALFARPLPHEGELILAGGNGHLARVAPGRRNQFLASLLAPIMERPVVADGRLYAAANGAQVLAWDLEEGRELWRWRPERPSEVSSGVAVVGEKLFVGGSRGFVYALKTDYGEQLWKRMLAAPVSGKPQAVGSKVLVFTEGPAVVCIAAEQEPRTLWSYDGAERFLAAGGEAVYLLTDEHAVVALALESGEELWRDPLPRTCRIAGDPQRPVLYLANTAGSIVAVAELDWYPPQ